MYVIKSVFWAFARGAGTLASATEGLPLRSLACQLQRLGKCISTLQTAACYADVYRLSVLGIHDPATCRSTQGVEGHEVPLPGVLSHLEGQSQRLVVWDVRGGEHSSFGQLLLLGRAAHCVRLLERSAAGVGGGGIDGAALLDLQGALQLMAALCGQQPSLVTDLMSLKVRGGWQDAAEAPELFGMVAGLPSGCLAVEGAILYAHSTQVLLPYQHLNLLRHSCCTACFGRHLGRTLPSGSGDFALPGS